MVNVIRKLQRLANSGNQGVIRKLEQGQIIRDRGKYGHALDDLSFLKDFNGVKMLDLYVSIGQYFNPDRDARSKMFEKYNGIVPFSELYKSKIGMCAETSILLQLLTQDKIPSYLVYGYLLYEKDKIGGHAFNIQILREGKISLVDITRGFASEITDIKNGNIQTLKPSLINKGYYLMEAFDIPEQRVAII